MSLLILLFALVMTSLGSFLLTRRFCDPSSVFHVLDHPNERSLHVRPTPRTGGLAIIFALAIGLGLIALIGTLPGVFFWIALGAIILATVSALDDKLELSALPRFAVHLGVALMVTVGGLMPTHLELPGLVWSWPLWMAGLVSVLFVGWMINLYNFMDGMDGFAGGMAIFGFGAFALFGFFAAEFTFAWVNLLVVTAVGSFLFFNFPPAQIFMGDAGSSVLGYLAASFALWGANLGVFPLWVAVLVFAPFIVDATVTLLRRLLAGERVWEAHKNHYYQRLVESGWGHKRTVLWEYALMAFCIVAAFMALTLGVIGQWTVVALVLGLFTGIMTWIDRRSAPAAHPFERVWLKQRGRSQLTGSSEV